MALPRSLYPGGSANSTGACSMPGSAEPSIPPTSRPPSRPADHSGAPPRADEVVPVRGLDGIGPVTDADPTTRARMVSPDGALAETSPGATPNQAVAFG